MSFSGPPAERKSLVQSQLSSLDSWVLEDVDQSDPAEASEVFSCSGSGKHQGIKHSDDYRTFHNTFKYVAKKPTSPDTAAEKSRSFFSQNKDLKLEGVSSKTFSSDTDETDKALYARSNTSSKSYFTYRDAPKQSNIENLRFGRKSKSSSSSPWSFGQLLSKKQSDGHHRTKSSGAEISVPGDTSAKRSTSSSPRRDQANHANSSPNVQQAQMKTKLRSAWNNMIYGLRIKREVNLKVDSAIWLLGQCYHNRLNDSSIVSQDVAKQLKLDLLSKIWLTYRINFPAIPGTDLVSDTGWGCMLRCGQMMMAQALVCHFLQRDWRLSSEQSNEQKLLYKMILRWFGDSMSLESPFSLHHLVSSGESYGRKAGDWYGPTHAAHVLRDALIQAKKCHSLLRNICMYVASDGIVFKQDVLDLFENASDNSDLVSAIVGDHSTISDLNSRMTNLFVKERYSLSKPDSERIPEPAANLPQGDTLDGSLEIGQEPLSFQNPCPSYSDYGPPSYNTSQRTSKSLILFVSVRLGNDKINPFYIPCLKSLLAYDHCIGIIGGRPKHALYFIGWQDDRLIHLDPHSCQPAIDVENDDFNEKSFHSSSVRTISFTEMDPSCAIGFYFPKKEDFLLFMEKFSEITAPMKRNLDYPVFALADGKRSEVEENSLQSQGKFIFSQNSNDSSKDDDDDYILL
ncbi:cysteine protease ATG4D-like [Uloborus diversus]|uniref:cysteine protease ATG4D-like n=1 Tax=Uloborus diversus TaxID=327109 RepID=UPI0024092F06|nr:cysteine protease ATG4D-like [Uloborus diversus]